MSMSGSDILKAVSIPFRIYNVEKLDIDKFIFTLSFQAIENCNISTAKKILYLAIQQNKIKRTNNSIVPQFDPWIAEIPLNWVPNLKGLEKVPEIELPPLPEIPPLELKEISFDSNEQTLSEPFQFGTEILKENGMEEPKDEREIPKKKPKISKKTKTEKKLKKLKKKTKKIKEIPKKQTTLVKASRKTKKIKKKKKTLLDFM
ncbi:MAG: DUF2240 family protein [Candidatus Helarchaeota archaeon]